MIKYAIMEYIPGDEEFIGCSTVWNDGYTDIKQAEKDRLSVISVRKVNPQNIQVFQYLVEE